jgi:predicted ATPase
VPPLRYQIALQFSGGSHAIVEEHLTQQRDQPSPFIYLQRRPGHIVFYDPAAMGLHPPTWELRPEELALTQVPRTFADAEALRSSLQSVRCYEPIPLDTRSVLRVGQVL